MNIVFFGTPKEVVPVLNALHKTFKTEETSPIVAVVTQEPKNVGRKRKLTHSPVDEWAHKKDIPKFHGPEKILEQSLKADIGIVVSYGEILKKNVIDHFPKGILNIHFSLLPKYRGASPVQAAIAAGEVETGITIMKIDEKLDHGHVVSQVKEKIKPDDTTETLKKRLFKKAIAVLIELLPAYAKGELKPKRQEESKASYTTLIKKSDGFIKPEFVKKALEGEGGGEWEIPFIKNSVLVSNPTSVNNFIRALYPWPCVWTYVQLKPNGKKEKGKRLKILKAHLSKNLSAENPSLILDEIQIEGKNPVSWKQFKEGYPEFTLES